MTPLMVAASSGNENALRFLIDHEASINFIDSNGKNAFFHALTSPNPNDVINLFLHFGGLDQLNAVTAKEETALHVAVSETGRQATDEILELLIKQGLCINAKTGEGMTPLMSAVIAGNTRSVSFLLKNRALTSPKRTDGKTALHLAFNHVNCKQIVPLLLQAGALPNTEDSEWNTPLHALFREGLELTEDELKTLSRLIIAKIFKLNDRTNVESTDDELIHWNDGNRDGISPTDLSKQRKFRNFFKDVPKS